MTGTDVIGAGAPDAAPAAPLASAAVPAAPGTGRARFVGAPRQLWRILVRGALLLTVTLGLYRFWLVTDVRRYLWLHTEIAGDGLEYVGTARELLLGFLIAIALLVPVYVLFFIAALDLGFIGRISGVLAFATLALLGQFAIYRARRYRLTRTVFRGLRFHQTGSAWRYAVCALFWWGMVALTLGLAYPFAQASLERFKMGNTFYGELKGRFDGSGWGLFFRGFLMWLLVMGPFVLGVLVAVAAVDWAALAELMRRRDNVINAIEDAGVGTAFGIAAVTIGWAILAAAALYPAFQAMMLRWWASGLRFGAITVTSRLGTRQVYGIYMRFLWYALLLGVVAILVSLMGLVGLGAVSEWLGKSKSVEVATTTMAVGGYVVVALAYSTIYQATVKFRLWQLGFESSDLAGLEALESVRAAGTAGSPLGEGLADALNVGGM